MSTSVETPAVPAPIAKAEGMRKNGQSTKLPKPAQSPLFESRCIRFCLDPTNPIVAFLFLGKNWHDNKRAFRPTAGLTSYTKRQELRKHQDAVKEREREMKQEKEAERQAHIQRIKDRRAAKEEKIRYAKMAEKMHHKRVERLKRREKRNKLLNS
ncbi:hypothetical protein N7454_011023 [Penicillium verhagenii]|nr:hypothetical protein N7454_011023 [Penicillium verhagenii]